MYPSLISSDRFSTATSASHIIDDVEAQGSSSTRENDVISSVTSGDSVVSDEDHDTTPLSAAAVPASILNFRVALAGMLMLLLVGLAAVVGLRYTISNNNSMPAAQTPQNMVENVNQQAPDARVLTYTTTENTCLPPQLPQTAKHFFTCLEGLNVALAELVLQQLYPTATLVELEEGSPTTRDLNFHRIRIFDGWDGNLQKVTRAESG